MVTEEINYGPAHEQITSKLDDSFERGLTHSDLSSALFTPPHNSIVRRGDGARSTTG
jgi:hypothetical protein